jgi:ATP-binding cassette, subfamily C (CFTR/MRP), member 1
VAVIFSSLQFFNVIRDPLVFFPFAISICADATVALKRISKFLLAEEAPAPYAVDARAENRDAVKVSADFAWETVGRPGEPKFDVAGKGGKGGKGDKDGKGGKDGKSNKDGKDKKDGKGRRWFGRGKKAEEGLPTTAKEGESGDEEKGKDGEKEDEKPFALEGLKLNIPKGSFVAIVGRVGSGKSSLLQAMIGEMKRTRGEVVFSGSVAYVPQTAWIMNATLRDNITFGRAEDETKCVSRSHTRTRTGRG